jgi:hypothetical protein
MTTRQEAHAIGADYFNGKVCSKHPELQGLRKTGGGGCIESESAPVVRHLA